MDIHKMNCLICGDELVYLREYREVSCFYCGKAFESKVVCGNNHYVCDSCHAAPSYQIVKEYCLHSDSKDPIRMFNDIIKHPSVNMHGPEHHFIVPAVLVTAYYNAVNEKGVLKDKLIDIEKRSKNILGGFCGFYGNCGAAVGTGIYMSIVLEANPLSQDEWKHCNKMTSISLSSIADKGGPRCCKRDSYIALREAINYSRDVLDVDLELDGHIICSHSNLNKQCLGAKCDFFIISEL